jgi:signal transduction histidine kinase
MRTRAAHIGGRIQIESSPQSGTRVVLTWPMEQKG